MIQSQEPLQSYYHPSRTNPYNHTKRDLKPEDRGESYEIYDPHPKLLFIERSLKRLSESHLIGLQYVQDYLLSQYRRNRSINTIRASFDSIHQFSRFLKLVGRRRFEEITCDDLSAYIEYEQDLGKSPRPYTVVYAPSRPFSIIILITTILMQQF